MSCEVSLRYDPGSENARPMAKRRTTAGARAAANSR